MISFIIRTICVGLGFCWISIGVDAAMGPITGVQLAGDQLTISAGADTVTVQVCRSDLLKVDYRPSGKSSPATLVMFATNWAPVGATINTNGDPITLATDDMRVEIKRSPCRISIYDATGTNLLLRERATEGVFADGARFEHKSGAHFYGINGFNAFENSSAGLLRNSGGWVEAGYQGDAGAPFVWTRNGFGVLVDSDGVQFNINSTNLTFEFISRTNIEYYVAVGSPEAIFSAVADISGKAPLFPKYAMGFANTEWGITQQELTNIVNTYRQKEIPIDQYVLDFDWKAWGENNYGEWRWNTTKFPGGPNGSLKNQMQAKGIRLAGIMKPRIFVNTVQGGYATTNGLWWPGMNNYSDYFSGGTVKDLNFALAACRTWFWDHSTNSFSSGIEGWWNDEADQRGDNGSLFDNWQHLNMQRALYEGQRSYTSQRVWSINRNFYLGAQRYAYAMWSGDISTGFSAMAAQRERMLTALNLGQAWWGMDIGGFNSGDPSSENYARWMQFGAVVPVYRVHGQVNTQRQPWHYGTNAEAVAKSAMQWRYRHIPYIYSHARRHTETGVGLVRPLVQVFPNDTNVVNYKDAWMFGDGLLAAPVVAQGQSSKSIYLPSGTWFDYAKGTRFSGGQTITYAVDSVTWKDLPLFVRQGAIIPTQPALNYVGEYPVTNVTVDIFPDSAPSAFTYYDDDGITYAYETGEYFKQQFRTQDDGEAKWVIIDAVEGTYVPALQTYLCRIYTPAATSVSINDESAIHYATLDDLAAASGAGWTESTNQFGNYVAVKVAAGEAHTIVVSNNTVATPVISPDGGAFLGSVTVTVSCATAEAEIRITTNGDEPTEMDMPYTAPLTISMTTTIKAKAFKEGRTPSDTATASFSRNNNLLKNGGFELGGSTTNKALHWTLNEPDVHGDTTGSGTRVNWRSFSGSWIGAIRGTWASAGSNGSLWQEVPAIAGRTYRLSAQFWADSNWSSGEQGLKLEFYSGTTQGVTRITAFTNKITGIGTSWTERNLQGIAPAGATWARVVVYADNVGANGALQFDQLELMPTNIHSLTIISAHGNPDPAVGIHEVDRNQTITNRVEGVITNGLMEYICTGWYMTGHLPLSGSGASMTMTVTNDATLRWLWITNHLEPVTLSFASDSYQVSEAEDYVSLAVERSGGTQGQVQVSYRTANGTALAGEHYTAATGLLVFASGVMSQSIEIPLLDNYQYEADKTFAIAIESPVNASLIAPTQAIVTIEDDDVDLGQRTLLIISEHGTPVPEAGSQSYDYGMRLRASIDAQITGAATQWVSVGWSGSGSVPSSGTTNRTPDFFLTNDSTLIWQWVTNVAFARSASGAGVVNGAANGWYGLGSSLVITATPGANAFFAGWEGDVPVSQYLENPLTLTMDRARSVNAVFLPLSGTNLLNNPSFEIMGVATTNALYWMQNDPDIHGYMWGSAARVNWRNRSGTWQATIRGGYAGSGNQGGIWQEVPAVAGKTYRLTGWFWADNTWTSGEPTFKLEFLDGLDGGVSILSATTTTLSGISQSWTQRTVVGTAPTNATWARVVIMARTNGTNGALQFDDMNLELLPYLDTPLAFDVQTLTTTSAVFAWRGVAQATGYRLDVATNVLFTGGSMAPGYDNLSIGNTTSLAITGLTAGATYYFRVAATNANATSDYSSVVSATLPNLFTWVGRADGMGSITPDGMIEVPGGETVEFIIQADTYYAIASIQSHTGLITAPPGSTTFTVTWNQVGSTGIVLAGFAPIVAETQGTPWWWLAQNSLTNSEVDFNLAEMDDVDGDGQPAWAEYIADTDPNNNESVLRVVAITDPDTGHHQITWMGSTNRWYDVYAATNLLNDFDILTNRWPGISPFMIYLDDRSSINDPVYYRIRVGTSPTE